MVERGTNLVRFFRHWVQNNFKSEQAGHPVGEEFDFIEIKGLGQPNSVVHCKVNTQHQIDYGREWDLYQRGQEQVAEGTPLREWPVMTHGEIVRLNSFGVYTIEAMVDLSDAGLQKIGPGTRALQLRAKAFLEEDAPKAAMANLRVKGDEDRQTIQDQDLEIKQLKARLAETVEPAPEEHAALVAKLKETEAQLEEVTMKRGPGRPKKAA